MTSTIISSDFVSVHATMHTDEIEDQEIELGKQMSMRLMQRYEHEGMNDMTTLSPDFSFSDILLKCLERICPLCEQPERRK